MQFVTWKIHNASNAPMQFQQVSFGPPPPETVLQNFRDLLKRKKFALPF